MPNVDDRKPLTFAEFLAEAMRKADLVKKNGELNPAALSRASGVHAVLLRRWLEGFDPTIPNLRRVAPALRLELRELMVAAGMTTAAEVGLEEGSMPTPTPLTTEEAIAADPRLTQRGKETLLYLAERFAGEREVERGADRGAEDDAPVRRRA